MKIKIILFLFIAISFNGCEKNENPFSENSYLLHPSGGTYIENYFGISTVGQDQLNPLKPSTAITFALPTSAQVTVWAVPVNFGSDETSGSTTSGGGTFLEIEAGKAVFYVRDNYEAGHHSIIWETKQYGLLIPPGWYRIYISSGEFFSYRDVLLIYRDSDFYWLE